MRPGFKTTEFWLTMLKMLVGPVLAFLVASGVLTPDSVSGDKVIGYIEQASGAIIALVGLVMSGRAVQTYTEARTGVKQVEAQMTAQAPIEADVVGFTVHDPEMEEEDVEDDEEPDGSAAPLLGFAGERLRPVRPERVPPGQVRGDTGSVHPGGGGPGDSKASGCHRAREVGQRDPSPDTGGGSTA